MTDNPHIRAMMDDVSRHLWGRTVGEAHAGLPTCVRCGEMADDFRDEVSKREWGISGLCQGCQDELWDMWSDEE